MVRPVLHAMTQDVDRAVPGNLALQPGQKLPPSRAVMVEIKRLGDVRLGFDQKGSKLGKIDTELAVVVVRGTSNPTGTPIDCLGVTDDWLFWRRLSHRRNDKTLQALLADVGLHPGITPAPHTLPS